MLLRQVVHKLFRHLVFKGLAGGFSREADGFQGAGPVQPLQAEAGLS